MDRAKEAPICCPHCAEPLSLEVVAKVSASSEVSIRLVPHAGELLDAKTVGQSIGNLGALLVAFGEKANVSAVALVKSLSTDDAGAITATLLIARGPEADERLKRRRARKSLPQEPPHE